MEVVFHTLDGSPEITFVQTPLLELGPHFGQLFFKLLVVEVALPDTASFKENQYFCGMNIWDFKK